MPNETRTVHEIAERVGLPARTVRYYDRIGLVDASRRSEAGYRLYDEEGEGRLRFVKQARGLGFSLDEIRELMAAAEAGCCGGLLPELDRLLAAKVAELDERIAEMREFRTRLAAFRAGNGSGCGCTGHGAFCSCLERVPQLLNIEKGGTGWPASVDAAARAARKLSEIKRDPDELRRILEEQREEIERQLKELEVAKGVAG